MVHHWSLPASLAEVEFRQKRALLIGVLALLLNYLIFPRRPLVDLVEGMELSSTTFFIFRFIQGLFYVESAKKCQTVYLLHHPALEEYSQRRLDSRQVQQYKSQYQDGSEKA